MTEKKGQITVFIIIGIIILVAIGAGVYIASKGVKKEIEVARPKVAKLPTQAQPLRDQLEACILQLATDGLKRIGDSGGYIDSTKLLVTPIPTEGEAIEFSPGAKPTTAYWWHMKSPNTCQQNCQFDTKRPPLYRHQGSTSIEAQLDRYITDNLKTCLGGFEEYTKKGCRVQELGEPQVTANIGEKDVYFIAKYPLRATCDAQTFDVEDAYVNIDLNLKEIYELATEISNLEIQNAILEQVTKNLIYTYSAKDSEALPPPRGFDIGPPKPGQYWIKLEVKKKIQELLAINIPLIQVSGTRNYRYIAAPPETRDPELYELTYNRQFLIPQNKTHDLEAKFIYLDWWEPYFDLNCNGQLCQSDSASNFQILQFAMNRYNFAYDLSYPVLVEIRNTKAFNRQGYSFKFMLEQNMRNSDGFVSQTKLLPPVTPEKTPSIFCDPKQQTSGNITINVKNGLNLQPMENASVSYICGDNNCNMGLTKQGKYTSKFPRCIGGTLRITKQGYATYSAPLDVLEEPLNISMILEPIRVMNATVKNYAITKGGKWQSWGFTQLGTLRPSENQTTTIMLTKNATPYDETFTTVVELKGDETGELRLVPGHYKVTIMSFFKGNITIPPDRRCVKFRDYSKIKGWVGEREEQCYDLPEDPLIFNQTSPFPYGNADYEWTITPDALRGKTKIEFRQFTLAIDKVGESDRIIEDLEQINSVKMYAEANKDRLYPVIT